MLYNCDCVKGIDELIKEKRKIHCVVTSPPYNVDLGNNKYNKNSYDLYKDNKEHQEYIQWLSNIFLKLYDIMEEGARLCINIGDGKNGRIPTHSDLIQSLTKKFLMRNLIIWNKNQVNNRTAWGSFNSPSSPSYPTPFEYILIFAKNSYKLGWKGKSSLKKEDFINNAFAIWNINPETSMKKYGHPAMFPVELPKRLIEMNTYIGDTVLDPFAGLGTTGVACKMLERNFIGFELSENYYKLAKERIENEN